MEIGRSTAHSRRCLLIMLRLPKHQATIRRCDCNRLIVPVVGLSATLGQLQTRAIYL
jgi:hypothetical protein